MADYQYTIRETVLHKEIFGSLSRTDKYEDDTVAEVIAWLQEALERVPPEYRQITKIDVESVGGYEGEHHAEVTIYYDRPETDAEQKQREREERVRHAEEIREAEARLIRLRSRARA